MIWKRKLPAEALAHFMLKIALIYFVDDECVLSSYIVVFFFRHQHIAILLSWSIFYIIFAFVRHALVVSVCVQLFNELQPCFFQHRLPLVSALSPTFCFHTIHHIAKAHSLSLSNKKISAVKFSCIIRDWKWSQRPLFQRLYL